MNKIIKFESVPVPNNAETQTDVLVYALTEGGKLYVTDATCKCGWSLMEVTEDKK